MSKVIEIPLELISEAAFAPYGELIAEKNETPAFTNPNLRSWSLHYDSADATELMFIRYGHQPMTFSKLERHFRVTQCFIPLGGLPTVMVVAPPTDGDDWEALPQPEDLRAFYVPGTVGILLWKRTWHALNRFPILPGTVGFALLTSAATQNELERQKRDGTKPHLTQEVDYAERFGVAFTVGDPHRLMRADP